MQPCKTLSIPIEVISKEMKNLHLNFYTEENGISFQNGPVYKYKLNFVGNMHNNERDFSINKRTLI